MSIHSVDDSALKNYRKAWDYYVYVSEQVGIDVKVTLEEYIEKVPEYQVIELIRYLKL